MTGLDHYAIGQDDPTQYGADWENAYIAGSVYSEYDDNDYFEVPQLLLVHPTVPKDPKQIQERIECAFTEYLATQEGGLEDGEYQIDWSDDVLTGIPVETMLKHGFVAAYLPYWGGVVVDMGWDSSYIGSVEIDEEQEDDDE